MELFAATPENTVFYYSVVRLLEPAPKYNRIRASTCIYMFVFCCIFHSDSNTSDIRWLFSKICETIGI